MTPFGEGWAVALNGVVLTSGCTGDQQTDTSLVVNRVVNPSFEVDMSHWEASNPAESTVTVTGDESYAGSFSVQVDATATTVADLGIELIDPTDFITAVENDHVWGSAYFLSGTATDAEVTISFYDAADVLISSVTGTTVSLPVGVFTRAYVDAVAPALTQSVRLSLNFVGGATNLDIVGWIDAAQVTIGETLVDYFDGDTQDTSLYGYAWSGTVNDSASVRTPCAAIYGTTVLDGLDDTPDGLGIAPLRTEDVEYTQRDGVRHFNDWYNPRILTFTGSLAPTDHCETCITVREKMMLLMQAWKRQCNDIELVLYPPCEPGEDVAQRVVTGPYGVIGRPRAAPYKWDFRPEQVVPFTLRFDAVDHRSYVLDPCGTPGLHETYDIFPGSEQHCVEFPICFPMCFTVPTSTGVAPVEVTIAGTECVSPTLTLYPGLTGPRVYNMTTGEWVGYNAVVTGYPVVIDTEDGTATQNGVDVTSNLIGSLMFKLEPADYVFRVLTQSSADDGYVQLSYRPTVIMV